MESLGAGKWVFVHCGGLNWLEVVIGLYMVGSVGPESVKETTNKREPSVAIVVASAKKQESTTFPHYRHPKTTRKAGYVYV